MIYKRIESIIDARHDYIGSNQDSRATVTSDNDSKEVVFDVCDKSGARVGSLMFDRSDLIELLRMLDSLS